MLKTIAIFFLFMYGCSHHSSNDNNKSSPKVLGGSYVKTGEMKSWNDYWIEAYIDTITQCHKLLLVHNGNNKVVTDSLNIGTLIEGMVLDYGTLRVNDKWNPEIVALFLERDSTQTNNVVKAWKGNSQTGKFEGVPTRGITRGLERE